MNFDYHLKDVKDEENQDFLEKRTLERGEKLVEEFPENKFAMEIVVRILLEDYDGNSIHIQLYILVKNRMSQKYCNCFKPMTN